ncbi:hybrid sensor histidine kinase/response regulator [Methylomonas sp. EFPC1]|uniref:hybrid sensor histidine kinase/response regulator n=1 Tax=Methylomonas sp. EFPC1 TaxID=2812647 RepID=UPI0019685017|nr:hybrid sensor histidine kinase/response regulator [Methylomonas sp. EFPC1]QSA99408.1 hybrid sensor histidine kinase/response regulator [Methylomonas sp. EFPC1]
MVATKTGGMRVPNPFIEHLAGKAFFRAPTHRPLGLFLDTKLSLSLTKLFAIPQFDEDSERQFWEERYLVLLSPLKWALGLGAVAFLVYILLDLHTGNTSTAEAILRLPIVLVLLGLFRYLNVCVEAAAKINTIAKLSAGLSAANLIAILLYDGNPRYYAETWPALLPMYFFSYGQMFMSLRATMSFGWSTALTMPLAGYWLGLTMIDLIPSILNLCIVNIFGVCTRCQLEAYARKSFREKRKAQVNAEDKTRFLQQMGHNLRQPLQALACYAAVLDAAQTKPAGNNAAFMLNRMGLVIDELNAAFNHVLDIANLETGRQIPQPANIDLNTLLTSLENQYAPQAAKRGIRLKVVLRRQEPYNLCSDSNILRQILGNLLDNAIKYTESGWILVSAVKTGKHRLTLHICDSGPGIAEEMREEVFKEFVRNQRRQNDNIVPGLGIGLAYVAAAVKCLPEHSLSLVCGSRFGCDFKIQLPVAEPMLAIYIGLDQNGDFSGYFVMVVDDDAEVLQAIAKQLRAWGCLVQEAASLTETTALLAENDRDPDLLITDFYLGNRETAHDIIAAVHSACGPVPTMILSARAISDHEKALLPAHTAVLRKPAGAKALRETMVKTLQITKSV